MSAKFIVSNSISYNTLADKIISLSPDVNKFLEPQTTLIKDDKPYTVLPIAERVGLSLHTKKKLQDETVWNTGVAEIRADIATATDMFENPLERSTMSIQILDRMNYRLSEDIWPGCKNYLATFPDKPYLDPVMDINKEYDLTPLNDYIDIRKFDQNINYKLPLDKIVYFNGDNDFITICEWLINKHKKLNSFTPETLREKLYGQPWFILETLCLTDTNPWKLMENNFAHVFERMDEQLSVYTKKQKEKINLSVNNEQIVIVDLGMIHLDTEEVGIGKYIQLCEQLEIRPNIKDFKELRSNIGGETRLATGSEPIPEPYNETIQSIGKLLLGFEDIKLDTSLHDIGWHLGCQIALKGSLEDSNVSLDFSNNTTISSVLDSINTNNKGTPK